MLVSVILLKSLTDDFGHDSGVQRGIAESRSVIVVVVFSYLIANQTGDAVERRPIGVSEAFVKSKPTISD